MFRCVNDYKNLDTLTTLLCAGFNGRESQRNHKHGLVKIQCPKTGTWRMGNSHEVNTVSPSCGRSRRDQIALGADILSAHELLKTISDYLDV